MIAVLLDGGVRNWGLNKYFLCTFLVICMTNNTTITRHYNMYPVTDCCTSEHCQEIQKHIGSGSTDKEWMNIASCISLVPFVSDAFDRYVAYKCNCDAPSFYTTLCVMVKLSISQQGMLLSTGMPFCRAVAQTATSQSGLLQNIIPTTVQGFAFLTEFQCSCLPLPPVFSRFIWMEALSLRCLCHAACNLVTGCFLTSSRVLIEIHSLVLVILVTGFQVWYNPLTTTIWAWSSSRELTETLNCWSLNSPSPLANADSLLK